MTAKAEKTAMLAILDRNIFGDEFTFELIC